MQPDRILAGVAPEWASMSPDLHAPAWMHRALLAAALLDLAVGGMLALAPAVPFGWVGAEAPQSPELWRGLGVTIALAGLGLAVASRSPFRYWPTILVSFLGKVILPVGFVWAASLDRLAPGFGALVVALGPIWWVPMAMVLGATRKAHRVDDTPPVVPLDMALSLYQDPEGANLLEASRLRPQFFVFLRHFGCTFCREALSDLSAIKEKLDKVGARLVLVHMSTESEAADMFDRHDLPGVTSISDPDRVLYRAFALRRGTPSQLYGWSVWKRGWEAGVKQGHGIGWLRGDSAQMPGAFVVSGGRVVAQFIHESASARPDYLDFAKGGVDQVQFQDGLEEDGLGQGFQERLRDLLAAESCEQR